ncbi:MAG: hypothetical protein FWF50_00600 [Defluviitaleaceae bacterium]|nr:hypothetical protein [Defluviitaleaceae bacterium]
MYTGKLTFKDNLYDFKLVNKTLFIKPKKEQVEIKQIEGCNSSPQIETKYLIGKDEFTGKYLVFFPKREILKQFILYPHQIELIRIIELGQSKYIKSISICAAELNSIYNLKNAIDFNNVYEDYLETGVFTVASKSYEETNLEVGKVKANNINIAIDFRVRRSLKLSEAETPLTLEPILNFSFQKTEDYEFIINLLYKAMELIYFLCYKRSIAVKEVNLITDKEEKGQIIEYQNNVQIINNEETHKRRIVYSLIAGSLSDIFQDIIDKNIYLNHIPIYYNEYLDHIENQTNFENNFSKDVSRFILVCAAFEYEYKRKYGKKVPKLFESTNFKKNTLANKIAFALTEHKNTIELFANYICSENKKTYSLERIAKDVAKQRNIFAHGNLYAGFKGNANIGISILTCLIYAMQLSHYKISEANIQEIIADLFFHKGLLTYLKEKEKYNFEAKL